MIKSALPESGTDTYEPKTPRSRETVNAPTATTTIGTQARPTSLVITLLGRSIGFCEIVCVVQQQCACAARRCGHVFYGGLSGGADVVSWYNERRLMHRLRRRPPAEAETEYYARLHAGSTPVTRNEVGMKPGMLQLTLTPDEVFCQRMKGKLFFRRRQRERTRRRQRRARRETLATATARRGVAPDHGPL